MALARTSTGKISLTVRYADEAPAEAVEAQDLPALLAGDPSEIHVGVHGHGMAHRLEHGEV